MTDIALWRLYLLRAGYLLIAVGMGSIIVPAFLHHAPWTLYHGVTDAMLMALVLLSVVGILHPLKMLPLLFWEMAWKATWLLAVALPAWRSGTMDADTQEVAGQCAVVAIYLFIIPWDYVYAHYLRVPWERWR